MLRVRIQFYKLLVGELRAPNLIRELVECRKIWHKITTNFTYVASNPARGLSGGWTSWSKHCTSCLEKIKGVRMKKTPVRMYILRENKLNDFGFNRYWLIDWILCTQSSRLALFSGFENNIITIQFVLYFEQLESTVFYFVVLSLTWLVSPIGTFWPACVTSIEPNNGRDYFYAESFVEACQVRMYGGSHRY